MAMGSHRTCAYTYTHTYTLILTLLYLHVHTFIHLSGLWLVSQWASCMEWLPTDDGIKRPAVSVRFTAVRKVGSRCSIWYLSL